MNRTTTRMLLLSGLAGAGMLVGVACASGPSGAGTEPAPSAAPTTAMAQAKAQAEAVHPRVSFARSCLECHGNRTPTVVEDWRESVHGETNVGCFICHGDGQEEFMVRPEPELCMSCHAGALDDYEVVEGHTFRFIKR